MSPNMFDVAFRAIYWLGLVLIGIALTATVVAIVFGLLWLFN